MTCRSILHTAIAVALAVGLGAPAGDLAAQSNNDWLRRQQMEQQRRQQEQERQRQQERERQREQERQRMREQERQRQREQERQRLQEQERQRQRDTERQRQTEQQRQQSANQNRQRQQKSGQAQQANRTTARGAAAVSKSNDRIVFSNGVAKLTRPLTAAEIRRGFTGKLTADGRALIKFQGRVFAVPASRVGIKVNTAGAARPSKWTEAKKESVSNDVKALSAKVVRRAGVRERATAGFVNGNRLVRERLGGPGTAIIISRPRRQLTPAEAARQKAVEAEWDRMGHHPPQDGFVSKELRHLPVGHRLSRYGLEFGAFTSPHGTPFRGRGLPPSNERSAHKVYEVLKPMPVIYGEAADVENKETGEVFEGGAPQYMHTLPLADLERLGYVKEITPTGPGDGRPANVEPLNPNARPRRPPPN